VKYQKKIQVPELKSFNELSNLSKTLDERISEQEKAAKYSIDPEDITNNLEIFESNGYRAIKITEWNEHFSKKLCKAANWCVKDKGTFREYGISENNPIFLILQGNRQVALFGHESGQIKNVNDGSIKLDVAKQLYPFIKELVNKYYNGKFKYNNDLGVFLSFASEEEQLNSIRERGSNIRYIIDAGISPSEEMAYAAVSQDGRAIRFLLEKKIPISEDVQKAAVSQNGEVIHLLLKEDMPVSEDVQKAAVSQNGEVIRFILKEDIPVSEDVQKAAVSQNEEAIRFILEKGIPSEEVQKIAVSKNGRVILYILDKKIKPSEEVQKAAVINNIFAFTDIVKLGVVPTEELQLMAVDKSPLMLTYMIKNGVAPTEKVFIFAVQKYENMMEKLRPYDFYMPNAVERAWEEKWGKKTVKAWVGTNCIFSKKYK
jgi:hypothetical protein